VAVIACSSIGIKRGDQFGALSKRKRK